MQERNEKIKRTIKNIRHGEGGKVSIIMSFYYKDSPELFKMSLTSIVSQSYKNIELIIVQDGPVPLGLSRIARDHKKRHKRTILLRNRSNKGLKYSLNKAIDAAKGEYLARQDADDHSCKDRIMKQVNVMKKEKLDILGTWYYELNSCSNTRTIRRLPVSPLHIYRMLPVTSPFCHGSVMFRKDPLVKLGLYSDDPPNEDYGLWQKALKAGLKMGNIPEPLYYFKVDPREYYKRRSGLKLALSESSLRFRIIKEGHYPKYYYLLAIAIFFARLLPAFIVESIYRLKKSYGFF